MPPQVSRKVIFDTNVYIHAIHGGAASRPYHLLVDSLPFTYLCSVVSAELYLGALDPWGIRLIHGFVSRSEKVGRVVTPTHDSWNESAGILAKIAREKPRYRVSSLLY
jgi:predicted nucleic acid-binding protein